MSFDVETYRHEFPVTRNWVYCNHAAVAPISTRVADAIRSITSDLNKFGAVHWREWSTKVLEARELTAGFIHCQPDEIAFVKNTSDGLSILSNGLDWKSGDKVVSINTEFPANFYPWLALRQKGVVMNLVQERNGRVDLKEIETALDSQTRVLTVSFVQYLSGFRMDLAALGEMCRKRDIIFSVDAIQGMGAFEIDVQKQGIDFLAADSHKWMLGTEGTGIAFISNRILDRVAPTVLGWMSVRHFNDFDRRELEYRGGSQRYECGSLNTIGIYGLAAAMELLHEVGIEEISRQILDTTAHLCQGLESKGFSVLGSRREGEGSGIVSFDPTVKGLDARWIMQRFEEAHISAATRGGFIRIAPHFYNTKAEMDHILDQLP